MEASLALSLLLCGCGAWPPAVTGAEPCVLTMLEAVSAKGLAAGSLTLKARVSASEGRHGDQKAKALVIWSPKGICTDMTFEYDPPQASPAPAAGGAPAGIAVVSTENSGTCGFLSISGVSRDSRLQDRSARRVKGWEGVYHFNP